MVGQTWEQWVEESQPTAEDYCASSGHEYHSDEGEQGRCYCGAATFPKGGPTGD